jgi:hypothetical protein
MNTTERLLIRVLVVAIALCVAACSWHRVVAPKPAQTIASTSKAPLTPAAAATSGTAKKAKELGYTKVKRGGQELYCQTSVATGSRLQPQTLCMTAAEIETLREHNQQVLENPVFLAPPTKGGN